MDREAWQATVYGFTNSRIQLKQLSIHCALVVHILGFPGSSVVKNLPANAGDVGSIPGLGRSLGGGHGNPLQDSCLENPMDRGAWWATVHGVAKSRTQLSENIKTLWSVLSFKYKYIYVYYLPL